MARESEMLDGREDQATGLRRLFRRAPPSVVAVFACGKDARELAAQALISLARGAGRVVVDVVFRGRIQLSRSSAPSGLNHAPNCGT